MYVRRGDPLGVIADPSRMLVRTVAKVSGWAYSLSSNGVAVNHVASGMLDAVGWVSSPAR